MNLDLDPDLYAVFHSSQMPPHGQNFVYYSNPEVDALMVQGREAMDQKQRTAIYQKLLDGKLDQRLRFLAREGLGYSHERKGKLQEAAVVFAKLGDDAGGMGGFYKDRASYHAARLAEMQGNPGEAIRIYREVLDKNPTTSLRDEISNRLALLELK